MTSKEEHLKRFKEERIAREKARIQMLHDLNRKKYDTGEHSSKYFKLNTCLNRSKDRSPVHNAIKRSTLKNLNSQNKPVKNNFHLNSSYSENFLNYSSPMERFVSLLEDCTPRRKSTHETASVDDNKPNSPK